MSAENLSSSARNLVDVRCVDPCHTVVGGNEGARCPPNNHCGCNGMRQCSPSGYCFGDRGKCIPKAQKFIQDGEGQVLISVFSGFSCCGDATLGRSARGSEQHVDSMERCLMQCTAAQWCAAAEWSPAEVINCFLMIHPDSPDDLEGLFGDPRQGKRLCMRTSWNSTLTAGGVDSSPALLPEEEEDMFLETNLTVCGTNVTLVRDSDTGGKSVPVYGTSEDDCVGGTWMCRKETLAVCLPYEVAKQFSEQHDWNCTEVAELPTTTPAPQAISSVDSEGSPAYAIWIFIVMSLLCLLGSLVFCVRRRWTRRRKALRMLPTYSDLGTVRSSSRSSIFSQRSLSNAASFVKTGSTQSIQDTSPKFPGHRREIWSAASPQAFYKDTGKVPKLQVAPADSKTSGCGFPGLSPNKGGWSKTAERPESRIGNGLSTSHVWSVNLGSFPGLRGAAHPKQDDVTFMRATWTFDYASPGSPPNTPQTAGAYSSWGSSMQRPGTSPPHSERSSSSAPAAVPEFKDPPRPNTASRAAAAIGNMAADFSAWTAQMRESLNSRSGSRPGSRMSNNGRRTFAGFGSPSGQQNQQPKEPDQERRGRSPQRSTSPTVTRSRTAPFEDKWDDPDEESSEEQPPIRRTKSSPGFRDDDARGRKMHKEGPRTSATSSPAVMRFADLRIDATSPEMADAILERKVDKMLWRLRSMTPRRHRNRVFLEQCRAWHPDKNTGEEHLATVAFQRLQSCRSWFLSDVDTDPSFVGIPVR